MTHVETGVPALSVLLKEAIPDWEELPEDCWITKALKYGQVDWTREIDIVSRNQGRPGAIRRVREEHPTNRPHLDDHDAGVLRVFTEVQAFAWANDVAKLGVPCFVAGEGAPDLRAGDWWVEAKTIEKSEEARALDRAIEPILRSRGF